MKNKIKKISIAFIILAFIIPVNIGMAEIIYEDHKYEYEDYNNIVNEETIDKDLLANEAVPYNFKTVLPIYEVDVTNRAHEYYVPLRIEILRNVSKLVDKPSFSVVYKYFNTWIKTGRVEKITFKYIINNSWLSENDISPNNIKLYEYNKSDKEWKVLDTNIVENNNKDNNATYFESIADNVHSFAIGTDQKTIILDENITQKNITQDEEETVVNEHDSVDEEDVVNDEQGDINTSIGFDGIFVILIFIFLKKILKWI